MDNEGTSFRLTDRLLFMPVYVDQFVDFIIQYAKLETPRAYVGILLAIRKFGAQPISYYASSMDIAKPNMTAVVDDLCGRGWVRRVHSVVDRRIINIELTEEGMSFIDRNIIQAENVLKEMFGILTGEEVQEFYKSIEVILSTGGKILEAFKDRK
jgi:DNA-binding MarR family transcriptional regulator